MFLLSRRQARAALAAAAGAATYLAASQIGARKLKVTGLFVVASGAMAGLMTARASSKAYSVESRLNGLLASGGTFGGTVTVNGDHHVSGTAHMDGGGSMGATLHFNQNHMDGVTEINEDGTHAGFHAPVYMNGHNLYMQGGTVVP